MAPHPQLDVRDATDDGSSSSPVTPVVIAGIAFAGAILFGLSVWLVVRAYRRYKHTLPTAKGIISERDVKAMPRQVPF
jgi:hypothetical protein